MLNQTNDDHLLRTTYTLHFFLFFYFLFYTSIFIFSLVAFTSLKDLLFAFKTMKSIPQKKRHQDNNEKCSAGQNEKLRIICPGYQI